MGKKKKPRWAMPLPTPRLAPVRRVVLFWREFIEDAPGVDG